MSLNWDVSKVEDKDFVWLEASAVYGDELPKGLTADVKYLNPKVESIIFTTMSTGIRVITIDNYTEFYKRYLMVCKASGYPAYFKLTDVFATIGLSTNADTKTYPAFKKDVISILEREVNWAVSQEVKELDK